MALECGSDTPESGTSLVEDAVNIAFDDIEYSVRNGFCSRGRKAILRGISGNFRAGELTVILGQSGAGKSSLMDILAGYTKPSNGYLYVNGRIRDERRFRRRSCYIMQDDQLQDMLTVKEALTIAANLKLGRQVSQEQKIRRVEEIISALGLGRARNTRSLHLSGGQKKRLAIGLELVSDPPVIFLDEPTSGLDSSISKQMVYLLHLLARQGRTVVATIHQPSAALLQMVDRLYAVSSGQCTYSGSVSQLVPYLETLSLKCPPFHNPVDFFIEVSAENSSRLVQLSKNGKNTEWITDIPYDINENLIAKYARSSSMYEELTLTELPPPKEDDTNKLLLKLKSTYSTSSWNQFATLTKRFFLTTWRNPQHAMTILGIHFCVGLIIGLLYFNVGEDAKFVRDNYNYLYFSLMFIMFTSFSAVSINFPQALPVARREHFNRWYSSGSYYAATLASVLPIQTICSITYACITFWMTGQPPMALRFFGFSLIIVLVSYVAICVGLLNGAIFSVKNGVVFGPFFIMPFTIFSGFFLRYMDAPSLFKWMFHVSFLKHGLVGLLLSIFGMDRPKLPCSDIYCHYTYPQQFLQDSGFAKETYSMAILSLFIISVVLIASSFTILKIRIKRKW